MWLIRAQMFHSAALYSTRRTASYDTLKSRAVRPPDSSLDYSGDFDLKGLQIASHLMERYSGRCRPWRFHLDAYAHALSTSGMLAHSNELNMLNALPDAFVPLVAMMQEKKQWAYQEGITHLLIADMRKFPQANSDAEHCSMS